MALIHHPELAVDCEVPDDTVDIWVESGWRPGTLLEPEPWEPQPRDANGDPIPPPDTAAPVAATDLGVAAESTVPKGDATTTSPKKG